MDEPLGGEVGVTGRAMGKWELSASAERGGRGPKFGRIVERAEELGIARSDGGVGGAVGD